MNKIKRIISVLATVSMLSTAAFPVYASEMNESDVCIQELKKELVYLEDAELIDDYGYFAETVSNLMITGNPQLSGVFEEEEYKGRYLTYYLDGTFTFVLLDVKDKLDVGVYTYSRSTTDKYGELFSNISGNPELQAGSESYGSGKMWRYRLTADKFDDSEIESVILKLEELKKEGSIADYSYEYDKDPIKYYCMEWKSGPMDRLYINESDDFDPDAASEVLRELNNGAKLIKESRESDITSGSTVKNRKDEYYIDLGEKLSSSEKLNTASVLKERFSEEKICFTGYRIYDVPDFTEKEELVLPSDNVIRYGDLNLDTKVDISDLSVMALYLVGDTKLSEDSRESADVQYDNEVNLADLAALKQYILHIRNSIGKPEGKITEITDSCKEYKTRWGLYVDSNETLAINTYSEYQLLINLGMDSSGCASGYNYLSDLEKNLEINKEFFDNYSLAIWHDNDSDGGARLTTTKIETDECSNITVTVDRWIPPQGMMECFTSTLRVNVIPKYVLPDGKIKKVSVYYTDTDKQPAVNEKNSVPVNIYRNVREEITEVSDNRNFAMLIDSEDKYEELNEQYNGIIDFLSDSIQSEDFFDKNTLVVNVAEGLTSDCIIGGKQLDINERRLNLLITEYRNSVSADDGRFYRWFNIVSVPKEKFDSVKPDKETGVTEITDIIVDSFIYTVF